VKSDEVLKSVNPGCYRTLNKDVIVCLEKKTLLSNANQNMLFAILSMCL